MGAFGPAGIPIRLAASAATNNATVGLAVPAGIHAITGYNASAATKYLKVYNKATAPAPATDTALLMLNIALPPTVGFALNYNGQKFPAGVSFAITAGSAEADNTSVALNDIVGLNITYELL